MGKVKPRCQEHYILSRFYKDFIDEMNEIN